MRRTVPWLLLLVACGGGGGPGLPEVRWGEDVCSRCRMIVSEPRFAAVVSEEGRLAVFDDVGELVLHLAAHPEVEGARWVHAFRGGGWLRAEEAAYVSSQELVTPMGTGWVALPNRAAADELRREIGGVVRSWSELTGEIAAGDGGEG